MIVDFQQHYTPPELLKGDPKSVSVQVDERGNPNYLLNPLLSDLKAHIAMMDRAGIEHYLPYRLFLLCDEPLDALDEKSHVGENHGPVEAIDD